MTDSPLVYVTYISVFSIIYLFAPSITIASAHKIYKVLKGSPKPYCDGIGVLKQTLITLNTLRLRKDIKPYELQKSLEATCQYAKRFFDSFTSSKTSVSIKIIYQIDNGGEMVLCLHNLCRDKAGKQSRDRKEYSDIPHYLYDNSCYKSIINDFLAGKNGAYYINQNVQETKDYLTTSLIVYSKNGNLNDLPYKSELVVPILPLISGKLVQADLLGFICIDSNQPYSFNGKYDLELTQCIADAAYDIIRCSYSEEEKKRESQ